MAPPSLSEARASTFIIFLSSTFPRTAIAELFARKIESASDGDFAIFTHLPMPVDFSAPYLNSSSIIESEKLVVTGIIFLSDAFPTFIACQVSTLGVADDEKILYSCEVVISSIGLATLTATVATRYAKGNVINSSGAFSPRGRAIIATSTCDFFRASSAVNEPFMSMFVFMPRFSKRAARGSFRVLPRISDPAIV